MATERNPRICFELLPPEEERVLPPSNFGASPLGSGPPQLALDKAVFWRNGRKLRVRFLGGSEFVRGKVEQYAKTWEKYANIKFEFGDFANAEIRISFQWGGGSWSYLGTTCLQIPNPKPTMNFGWFNDETRDEEFSRTTIHEFGHSLGCIHEHMSPASSIPWDKPAVYKYFMGPPNNWPKAKIDANLFNRYPASGAVYSKFDPWSIMCYEVSDDMTIGTYSIPRNMVLSATDKAFIRQVYPPRSRSEGNFNTVELREPSKPKTQNSKQFVFEPAYKEVPNIAVGLTELDISNAANIRVKGYADRITEKDFNIHIDGWSDTVLYSAGATWLEVADSDSDIQVGKFDTLELRPWNDVKQQNQKRINFTRSFQRPPNVIVWINGIDMDKNHDWRVTAYASDINAESFVIHIDAWGDTALYSASASWVAFPADQDSIFGGFADTSMDKKIGQKDEKAGYVAFPAGKFDQGSKVFIAIKSFDFAHDYNLRFKTGAEVSNDGFKWKVDTWADSICYGAGISYIVYR